MLHSYLLRFGSFLVPEVYLSMLLFSQRCLLTRSSFLDSSETHIIIQTMVIPIMQIKVGQVALFPLFSSIMQKCCLQEFVLFEMILWWMYFDIKLLRLHYALHQWSTFPNLSVNSKIDMPNLLALVLLLRLCYPATFTTINLANSISNLLDEFNLYNYPYFSMHSQVFGVKSRSSSKHPPMYMVISLPGISKTNKSSK